MSGKTLENQKQEEYRKKINEIFKEQIDFEGIDTVYHYTNPTALKSIIETGTLWATNILYLNDQKEFKYAIELFDKIIQESNSSFIENLRDSQRYKDFIEGQHTFGSVYITSFTFDKSLQDSTSNNSNKLSMWRGYCPNGGYAIGLNIKFFYSKDNKFYRFKSKSSYYLAKCIYERDEQYNILKTIVDKSDAYLRSINDNNDIQKRTEEFFRTILFFAPILKHPAFKEEEEVRFVLFERLQNEPKFKSEHFNCEYKYFLRKHFLVPYVEYENKSDFKKNLSSIFVGPMSNQDLAKQSVEMLLKTQGYPKTDIVKASDIPYREF